MPVYQTGQINLSLGLTRVAIKELADEIILMQFRDLHKISSVSSVHCNEASMQAESGVSENRKYFTKYNIFE